MVCFVQIFLNAIIDQKSRYEWFKLWQPTKEYVFTSNRVSSFHITKQWTHAACFVQIFHHATIAWHFILKAFLTFSCGMIYVWHLHSREYQDWRLETETETFRFHYPKARLGHKTLTVSTILPFWITSSQKLRLSRVKTPWFSRTGVYSVWIETVSSASAAQQSMQCYIQHSGYNC